MKTKEELNALKSEVEALNGKLVELTENELESVTGGAYDMITDEDKVKALVNSLINRATQDLMGHYAALTPSSKFTEEQITYWNQRFRLYYGALTEDEQRMVIAYLSQQ